MEIFIRAYRTSDLSALTDMWNGIVEEANSFPQEQPFSLEEAQVFFDSQSYIGVATNGETLFGFYILHPNNVGRCSHTANASYGIAPLYRGNKIGWKLVEHSLHMCKELGFRGLQFNAVVCQNVGAIALYEKIGFRKIGFVVDGYRLGDGSYADIYLYHKQT